MKAKLIIALLALSWSFPSSAHAAEDFASAAQEKLLELGVIEPELAQKSAIAVPEKYIISRDPPGMLSARPQSSELSQKGAVRRQIIWARCERDLAECWPHLVDRS